MKLDEIILESYKINQSVKATAKDTGCSWHRVVKSLSSCGVLINDTHRMILEAHESGMSVSGIAKQLGISVKTVQAYLPRVRPVYGESTTVNAQRVRECRERRKRKQKK